MPTELLFRDNAYLKSTSARVLGINERNGIILDRTVFYATGGGQPGDVGVLLSANGTNTKIANTVYGEDKSQIIHVPAEGEILPEIGSEVAATLDSVSYTHLTLPTIYSV